MSVSAYHLKGRREIWTTMCALVGRSYDKVSCVALSMANPDLEVRLGG